MAARCGSVPPVKAFVLRAAHLNPGTMSDFRLQILVWGWTKQRSRGLPSRSFRPKVLARVPVSDCRWHMVWQRSLGGALTIQSRQGVGTNIDLWLPISAAVLDDGAVAQLPFIPGKASGVVLLVDDEEVVRASTADMLEELGYDVRLAESGEEALKQVGEGLDPDLLVTDHLMPGMTGVDLVRALRETKPNLPVLIVSGYAETEGIAPNLPRLTKPFRSAELEASLATLTAGR